MTISVVLCTYNGEAYMEEQLSSILKQSRPVDEIIVLDDGSKDDTIEIAERILSKSGTVYRIVRNEENLGAARNFEKGIRLAKGEIVLTSDQDDVWFEQKTADFEAVFREKSDCVLAFSDACVADAALNVIQKSLWLASGFTASKQKQMEQGQYYEVLFSDNVVTGAAMAVRREFACSCAPAPEGTLHDYWFALCAPMYGKIVMIKKPELWYRQHGANVMGAPAKGIWKKMQRWMHTVEILTDDREKRAGRAEALKKMYDEASGSEKLNGYRAQVDEWCKFSVGRNLLRDRGTAAGMRTIFRYCRQGRYRKYVDKKGIVLQELLSLFVNRRKG